MKTRAIQDGFHFTVHALNMINRLNEEMGQVWACITAVNPFDNLNSRHLISILLCDDTVYNI